MKYDLRIKACNGKKTLLIMKSKKIKAMSKSFSAVDYFMWIGYYVPRPTARVPKWQDPNNVT